MTDFDNVLARFRQAGSPEGEGSFTWDYQRALKLLPEYQLAGKSEFWLRLVASAAAGGASDFNVRSLKSGYEISWDGQTLSLDDLQQLLPSITCSDPRLSELATAVLSAHQTYPELQLESPNGRLRLVSNQLQVEETKTGSSTNRLRISGNRSWPLLRRWQTRKELNILVQRCSNAHLNWSLPKEAKVPHGLTKGTVIGFGRERDFDGTTLHIRKNDETMGRGWLLLQYTPSPAIVVRHGVDYQLEPGEIQTPGRLIWWTDDFELDISRSSIVREEKFEAWRLWLNSEIEWAIIDAKSKAEAQQATEILQEWLMWKEQSQALSSQKQVQILYQGFKANMGASRYPQALTVAESAARKDPSYWWAVALAQGMMERFDDSFESYQKALRIQPDQAFLHTNLAEDLMVTGQMEKALKRVEIALNLDPDYADAKALKAKLIANSAPDEALKLAKSTSLHADCPMSIFETLGLLYLDRGERELAAEHLQIFLEKANPSNLWESKLPERLEKARFILEEIQEN